LEHSITDGDDDDYSPKPRSRVTRSASKVSDRKSDLKFEIGQEYQQCDVSISSTTSIDKTSKKRIKEELIGSASSSADLDKKLKWLFMENLEKRKM
jgi:hypothetical protein